MTESAMHPSSGGEGRLKHPSPGVGEEAVEDPQSQERLDTDPEAEPSAPNRAPQPDFVRSDLKDDSAVGDASDDDELDKPDN